ncbi:phage antirepressor N-terminal domain-containing protein [Chromobacterium sp. IIBBL 290-4]|uniref:phage antirepressor N-terminal domain-containing protein n=1 Tax=Chromobacterium sp. IIBBL 290-4 TaxID=2953890 RepID=UPI0020B81516|nr:phage antirepressor N-terminal domain-containing protein [Chromobacterium sp. IIBBL 290-4]UTH72237.1 phage antirepressor N-terminal domain-containing protein [Chromobacterium sp. IIBBL 290-4]
MSKSIVVHAEFAGVQLEGVISDGVAYVAMLPIVEGMGLSWARQYRKLMSDPVLCSIVAQMAMVGADGKQRQMLCLPAEYLQGWLFKVNPDKVKAGVRDKVIHYQRECFRVLNQAFTQGQAKTDYRVLAVDSKRAAGRLMTDVMRDVMLLDGKTPKRHHFMNEHCLLNWCVTGNFARLDESGLNADQLALLADLRRRDAVLIARGLDYSERKAALQVFASEQRQRLAIPANDAGRLSA